VSRLGGKGPHPGGREPSEHQSRHELGSDVRKERPREQRMGSTRYTEGATGTWHLGREADIAKHKNLEPSSGNYSRNTCC